jgi:hypothetical protein
MNESARHQWGPSPSGQAQHRAVCRRCGLEEVTTWRAAPDGRISEVVAWVAPTGRVLATRAVRSQATPRRLGLVPTAEEYAVPVSSTVDVLPRCPGTPDAWRS